MLYPKDKNDRRISMAFQLKSNRKETENKTILFPLPLIEEIEKAIQNKDVTFSSFIIQACEYALRDMDE
jgi:hypothetical protein